MIAIILAAGSGRRMGINKPKGLLNLNGKPLIEYSIDNLIRLRHIKEIILVTGFESEKYNQYLKKMNFQIPITVIINDIYSQSGSLYSLFLALKLLKKRKEDFLILDSDIIYDFDNFKEFIEDDYNNAVMATNVPVGRYDACYIDFNNQNFLYKITKDISQIKESHVVWEHIGIVKNSKQTIEKMLTYCDEIFNNSDKLNHEYDTIFEKLKIHYKIIKFRDYIWSEVDDDVQLIHLIVNILPKINMF